MRSFWTSPAPTSDLSLDVAGTAGPFLTDLSVVEFGALTVKERFRHRGDDGLRRAAGIPRGRAAHRQIRVDGWPRGCRVRDVVHEPSADPYDATSLAAVAQVGVPTRQDAFRRHVGMSPMAYVNEVRRQIAVGERVGAAHLVPDSTRARESARITLALWARLLPRESGGRAHPAAGVTPITPAGGPAGCVRPLR